MLTILIFSYASSSTPHPCQSVSRWVIVSDKSSLELASLFKLKRIYMLLLYVFFAQAKPTVILIGKQAGNRIARSLVALSGINKSEATLQAMVGHKIFLNRFSYKVENK